MNKLEEIFKSSVQDAVQISLDSNKPLFVFLSKEDSESDAFVKKFLFKENMLNEGIRQRLVDHYVSLKLIDKTSDMAFFRDIFKNIELPSFYIVSKGQLIHKITKTMSPVQFCKSLGLEQGDISLHSEVESSSCESLARPSRTLSYDGNVSKKQRSVSKSPPAENVTKGANLKNRMFNKSLETETERIRTLLKADQKERELLRKECNSLKQTKSISEEPKQQPKSNVCSLSIRLFNGNALKHDFKPNQTLNDVRSWLDTETNEEIISNTSSMPSFAHSSIPQPTRYAFHRPSLPRITYSDEQEFKTLVELELCPRSVLILKPIYDEKGFSNSYPDGKTTNRSIFSTMGSTLSKVGNALYSFFDYGVEDGINLHRDEYPELETSSIDDTGNSSGHNNYVNSYARDDYFQPRDETTADRGTPNILSIDNLPPQPSSLISLASQHNIVNDAVESNEGTSVNTVVNSRTNSPKPIHIRRGAQTLQNGVEEERSKNENDN